MSNVIEIKAMSQEQAITRALKIMEATPEQIVKVVVKQKSRSFLGLFNKEGIYEIEIDKNLVAKPQKIATREESKKEEFRKREKKEEKQREEKPKFEKTHKNEGYEKKFHKEDKKIEDKKLEKIEDKKADEKLEKIKSEPVKEEKIERVERLERVERPKYDATEDIRAKAKELLEYIGLILDVEVKKINERNYLVNLYGEDNGIIIGKKGKTLNSFEYLLNSMMKNYRIEVDVEGFKAKRTATLKELAKKMANKAMMSNRPVRLNPMPPRERKIIHEIVNRYPELDTYSEGRDPKRYIVIKRKK